MPMKLRILLYEAESEAALARQALDLPDTAPLGGPHRFTVPKPYELADGLQPGARGVTIAVHTITDPDEILAFLHTTKLFTQHAISVEEAPRG